MFVDEGLIKEMDGLLNESVFDFEVRLYDNTITIAADTIEADLSPPTFTGYAAIPITAIAFPGAAVGGDGAVFTNSPTIEWENTAAYAGATIKGISVHIKLDGGASSLWFAENFAAEEAIVDIGDKIQKKLNFKKRNY